MSMDSIPIIEVQVRQMQLMLKTAILDKIEQQDEWILSALERELSADRIHALIDEEVRRTVEAEIRRQVEQYFRAGPGRELVARRVLESLQP